MISDARYYLGAAIVFAGPIAAFLVLILAPFFTSKKGE